VRRSEPATPARFASALEEIPVRRFPTDRHPDNALDNLGGSITSTADTLIGAVPGVNGRGTLAIVTLTVLRRVRLRVDASRQTIRVSERRFGV
jgi:hypothetical protein